MTTCERQANSLIAAAPVERRRDLLEVFLYRAGIGEYEGGLTRAEADRQALAELKSVLKS